jgi:hypothetical protein
MFRRRIHATILVALTITSCHTVKEVVRPKDIPLRSAEKIVDLVLARDTGSVRYYKAKADVELEMPDGTKSFGAHIRSVLDSAAWVSVTPALGIEVARAVLTTDSLKLLDRLNDQYWLGDTAAAEKRFGLQPSLGLLQDALLGRAIGLDAEEKYKIDREEGQYVLTSKEKRKFRRAAEDLAPDDTLANDRDMKERRLARTLRRAVIKDAVVFRFWVEPDSFLVTRVLITDLAHDQQADVRYMERVAVNGRLLPAHVTLSLSDATRHASGSLRLDRIELEGPLQLPFKVPEKFEPMP